MPKNLYFAADHGGLKLKNHLINNFSTSFIKVDLGPYKLDQLDDYPVYAFRLTDKILKDKNAFGVLICWSGIGMSIAANKVRGIRAALCTYAKQAEMARAHNNANVLVLGADFSDTKKAVHLLKIFLKTDFSKDKRHHRRVRQICKKESL